MHVCNSHITYNHKLASIDAETFNGLKIKEQTFGQNTGIMINSNNKLTTIKKHAFKGIQSEVPDHFEVAISRNGKLETLEPFAFFGLECELLYVNLSSFCNNSSVFFQLVEPLHT